jgi:hypothetical protein
VGIAGGRDIPLWKAEQPQGLAPHPPLRIVRQRQSRRQHRTGARVACRTVPLQTGRDLRDRRGRRTPCAAASMSLLRRPHDHHRDLRRRLPAEISPCAGYSGNQNRYLVMPSPPTHQPTDIRRFRWLSASTAPAYSRSMNRPAVAPPTLSSKAPSRSFSPSPRPILRGKAIRAGAPI